MPQEDYISNPLIENAQVSAMAGQGVQASTMAQQQQYILEEKENSLVEAQLECESTLNKIYHKLRQDYIVFSSEGKMDWVELEEKKRILTDEGVNRLMQVMESYINKETLLSNFNEEQIKVRMLKFCNALNSNIYMKYEFYFRIPTTEECKNILIKQIDERVKSRINSIEILDATVPDEVKIKKEIIEEFGDSVEDEIERIKLIKLSENFREYELLFTQLEALVDATHNRAWKGEERGSFRRHFNISEVIGTQPQQQKQGGMFKWMGR